MNDIWSTYRTFLEQPLRLRLSIDLLLAYPDKGKGIGLGVLDREDLGHPLCCVHDLVLDVPHAGCGWTKGEGG